MILANVLHTLYKTNEFPHAQRFFSILLLVWWQSPQSYHCVQFRVCLGRALFWPCCFVCRMWCSDTGASVWFRFWAGRSDIHVWCVCLPLFALGEHSLILSMLWSHCVSIRFWVCLGRALVCPRALCSVLHAVHLIPLPETWPCCFTVMFSWCLDTVFIQDDSI